MTLPESVLASSEHEMVAEDVVLELFRRRLPGVRFTSLIEQDRPPPYVLLRKANFGSEWQSDDRFLDYFYFSVETFTSGLEADAEGPLIIAAMKNELTRAALAHDPVLDGLGWVQDGRLVQSPRRRADFANSEGPVQYADLPQDYARYMATFFIQIKRAHAGPNIYNV